MSSAVSVPQALSDVLSKKFGLAFLSGQRQVDWAQQMTQYLTQNQRRFVFYSKGEIKNSIDIVVFPEVDSAETLKACVDLADEGRLVLAVLKSHRLMSALNAILASIKPETKQYMLWRLTELTQLMIHQVQFKNLQGQEHALYEMLLFNSQLKEMVRTEKILDLDQHFQNSQERSWMVTLNQAILQSLIRRHIDVKQAFELSYQPEDLDRMMKKVGI